jgi:hypothetical protein
MLDRTKANNCVPGNSIINHTSRTRFRHAAFQQMFSNCRRNRYFIEKSAHVSLQSDLRQSLSGIWELLQSLGREWMWEDVKEGDTDVEWVRDDLINGTFIGVTDGSYDREKAKTFSSTG